MKFYKEFVTFFSGISAVTRYNESTALRQRNSVCITELPKRVGDALFPQWRGLRYSLRSVVRGRGGRPL